MAGAGRGGGGAETEAEAEAGEGGGWRRGGSGRDKVELVYPRQGKRVWDRRTAGLAGSVDKAYYVCRRQEGAGRVVWRGRPAMKE